MPTKPTDVRPSASALYFLPITNRVPLKFGPEVTTEVTCARARVTVRDRSGRTAEGWGYDYYVLPSLGNAVSTLMGCPPGSERQAFVTTQEQPLIRYNSRLPLVVYAPSDVEVRYRLWRAAETQTAP